MKYDYLKQPLRDSTRPWISRPLLPITLYHQGSELDLYALLDSGADTSLFHYSIAQELALELEAGRKKAFSGIGGDEPVVTYVHTIEMKLKGSPEQIEITAGFTKSDGVSAILGQKDFFDHYRICFEKRKERIQIRSNN